jgi:hypothetical protein
MRVVTRDAASTAPISYVGQHAENRNWYAEDVEALVFL